MNYNILGGLAVSALLIAMPLSNANAAPHPRHPPPPPPPAFSWTGFYVGGNLGGGWTSGGSGESCFNSTTGNTFRCGIIGDSGLRPTEA